MYRKIIVFVLLFLFLMAPITEAYIDSENITTVFNNSFLSSINRVGYYDITLFVDQSFEKVDYIINNRTIKASLYQEESFSLFKFPIRLIIEELGGTVGYNQGVVSINFNDRYIEFTSDRGVIKDGSLYVDKTFLNDLGIAALVRLTPEEQAVTITDVNNNTPYIADPLKDLIKDPLKDFIDYFDSLGIDTLPLKNMTIIYEPVDVSILATFKASENKIIFKDKYIIGSHVFTKGTLFHEIGHAVDAFYLDPEKRKKYVELRRSFITPNNVTPHPSPELRDKENIDNYYNKLFNQDNIELWLPRGRFDRSVDWSHRWVEIFAEDFRRVFFKELHPTRPLLANKTIAHNKTEEQTQELKKFIIEAMK